MRGKTLVCVKANEEIGTKAPTPHLPVIPSFALTKGQRWERQLSFLFVNMAKNRGHRVLRMPKFVNKMAPELRGECMARDVRSKLNCHCTTYRCYLRRRVLFPKGNVHRKSQTSCPYPVRLPADVPFRSSMWVFFSQLCFLSKILKFADNSTFHWFH